MLYYIGFFYTFYGVSEFVVRFIIVVKNAVSVDVSISNPIMDYLNKELSTLLRCGDIYLESPGQRGELMPPFCKGPRVGEKLSHIARRNQDSLEILIVLGSVRKDP